MRTEENSRLGTLANTAAVLRLFRTERLELTVSEVSRDLSMPKSSASRLLRDMRDQGLLARTEGSGRYKVGNLMFELASLYRLSSPLIEVVDQEMKQVCDQTGHTGYISILDGADVLVIRAHPGTHALRVFTPLGQRAPAFATANGRSLLARLPEKAVRALHAEGLEPPSPNAPGSVTALLTALQRVRRQGWAEAVDEAIPGVGSVAVSVADREAGETLGFCLSFPASTVKAAERRRIVALLVAAGRRIAAQFGDPFFGQPVRALPLPGIAA